MQMIYTSFITIKVMIHNIYYKLSTYRDTNFTLNKVAIRKCITWCCTTIVFTLLVLTGNAQVDIKKIIPPSPNAAEIAKYGEIPVGYYTGIPNVSIPLYQIKTNNFDLPLGLSYHAGGNKVESTASWVGLGWSLSSIPIITRSVNGQPDESDGGMFYKYQGKTVKQLMNEANNGQTADYSNFLRAIRSGTADSEPDIYYYSLNGKSGKFYYDQDHQKFVSLPKENIVIKWYDNSYFTIVSDNGDIYYFTEKESSQRNSTGPGPKIVTSWCVSKIVNAAHTDSILFSYNLENQWAYTYTAFNKYQFIGGTTGWCAFDDYPDSPNSEENKQSLGALTITEAKNINGIYFRNGYVKFNVGANRIDLNGGTVLDNVEIFNKRDELVKKFKFKYTYKTASSGYNCIDTYSLNWLFLKELQQVSVTDTIHLDHKFIYDDAAVPCRGSTAQDYWGYYNGKVSNQTLIPTQTVSLNGSSFQFLGANRSVDPLYSKFGVLKKMIYPTGGYSEFEVENNEVGTDNVPKSYVSQMQALDGEGTPTTDTYEATFVINNPKDKELNNNNDNGGTFIDVNFDGLGCDFSNGATPCCNIALQRLDNAQYIYQNIASPFTSYYIPNGTYKMIIHFNTNFDPPPNYGSFFYMITWRKIDSTVNQRYAGGLRIKEIRNFSSGSTQSAIVQKYKYTNGINSTISSGDVLSPVRPGLYVDYISYIAACVNPYIPYMTEIFTSAFLRSKAYSNVQQVTYSGSYVGYKNVIIQSNDPSQTGITVNTYSHVNDIPDTNFPYPPAQSNEVFRGNLLTETQYKYNAGEFWPVRKIENTYTPEFLDADSMIVYGLKAGIDILSNNPEAYAPYPSIQQYDLRTEWNKLSQKKETVYSMSDTTKYTQTVSNYQYDPNYNLLAISETVNSKGQTLKSNFKYTKDSASVAPYTQMLQRNIITPVLQNINYVDASLAKVDRTKYAIWLNSNDILPQAQQTKIGNGDFVIQVIYKDYDNLGNIRIAKKPDGPPTTYLWGYNQQYPIAEAKNAPINEVYHHNFEETLDFPDYGVTKDATHVHTGNYAGLITNTSGTEATMHSNTMLQISLAGTKRFRYSGWVYSNGPSVDLYLFMKQAGETSYFTYVDAVSTTETGKWVYLEKEFDVPANITQLNMRIDNNGNGNVWFDDLAIYPADAQLTTYTYKPLVGMTSTIDPKGQTTYYEYDSFQRLKAIKDQNGNIVKQMDYHYQNQ